MSLVPRIAIVLFAWLLCCLPASQAQERKGDGLFGTLSCKVGQGCRCLPAMIPIDEWEFIMQRKAPEGAENMLLVLPNNGEMYWTSAQRDRVHRSYGGKGRCEMELFDDRPADGIWEFENQPADLSNCPLLTTGAGGIKPPSDLEMGAVPVSNRMEIRWGGHFDVRKYMHPDSHAYWRQVDDNNWDFSLPQLDAIPAHSPVGIKVHWRSTMVSGTRIRGIFSYRSRFIVAGAEALLERMQCDMTATYTGRWVAPLPGEEDPRNQYEVEY